MAKANFQQQLDEKFPNEFTLVGEYKNNRTKVEVKHNKCGKVNPVNPSSLLNGKQKKCSFCYQQERIVKSIDSYLEKKGLTDVFTYDLGEALYQYEKITFHCHVCNNDFPKKIDTFKQGQHCPYCAGQRTNKNSAQHKIDTLTSKGEFTLLNEVDAHDSPAQILHNVCGRITETSLSYFVVQFPECRHCAKEKNRERRMKAHDDFVKEVKEIYGEEFIVTSEYSGATERVNLIHTFCRNELNPKANHILTRNFGCKYCSMSTPESIIYDVLKQNEIEFEFQYYFDDCVGEKGVKLPFDFAILSDGELKFIIEYDGQQHVSELSFGKESYERTVRNDNIKNNYCSDNGIKLYRIPFTELKNLREIVQSILDEQLLLAQ